MADTEKEWSTISDEELSQVTGGAKVNPGSYVYETMISSDHEGSFLKNAPSPFAETIAYMHIGTHIRVIDGIVENGYVHVYALTKYNPYNCISEGYACAAHLDQQPTQR